MERLTNYEMEKARDALKNGADWKIRKRIPTLPQRELRELYYAVINSLLTRNREVAVIGKIGK